MRQLIISLILAVCLVGCGEKPKFSINEKDSADSYASNPIFTKIDSDFPKGGDVYKFTGVPESVNSIKTNDLDVLGGYVAIEDGSIVRAIILTMKGKASFDKLLDRLNQSDYIKDMNCIKVGFEKGSQLMCNNFDTNKRNLVINYNSFIDSVTFTISVLGPKKNLKYN